jgi:uncharacterized phiE125 gp8 family phage protein
MGLVLKSGPDHYPVTLIEAKAHIGILSDEHDDRIAMLIGAATELAQTLTRRQLVTATYELYTDSLHATIEIPKPPLIAVDSIEYIPAGEMLLVRMPEDNYTVDTTTSPGEIIIHDGFIPSVSGTRNCVKITFSAGHGDASTVPLPIKQWMLLQIATWFETREEFVIGTVASQIKNIYNKALIDSYKVITL